METLMTWIGPALDVLTVALLAGVVWRLGRDTGAEWEERETRLQAIFADLRGLAAQSEGLARDLDGKLGAREERLQRLLGDAERVLGERGAGAATSAPRAAHGMMPEALEPIGEAAADDEPALVAARIEALAESGATADDIARRLDVAPAEVRLVIGLKTARAARLRAAAEPSKDAQRSVRSDAHRAARADTHREARSDAH